ncbi:MAG: ATP-binding protein [Candidatus Electrothrix sp. Rat3]|nr:ATP-binding protein [Candidatus Electrothrix rattekaaiensis]
MKKVSEKQVIKRIKIENPWWETQKIPTAYLAFKPRSYLELFYPLVQTKKIQRATVLMGPRRVGKTVILHHTIQNLIDSGYDPNKIGYFSVDHPIYNGLGLEELLELFSAATETNYHEDECYIFFDEIQYLKNWENHLKLLVDRQPNLKCTVSGSAAAALKLKSSESGAGRFTDFLLPPLTFHEYLELLDKNNLVIPPSEANGFFKPRNIEKLNESFIHYLNYGGYPEVIFSDIIQSDPGRFIKSDIIDKVLLRDLPGLYGIQDIQELNYLFTTLAFNSSNEVSLEELSKGSGVAKNTIKKYIEYLEAAFLIRTVHRIDRTAKRFKRANFFKVYLTNPSIRSALFSPVAHSDEAIGALSETAIYSQWFHSDTLLHYARWKNGEVDIVHLNKQLKVSWAIEVKWTDRFFTRPHELKSLIQFCHSNNVTGAAVTTMTKSGKVTVENVNFDFIPTSLYCYTVGYNIVKGKQNIREGLTSGAT